MTIIRVVTGMRSHAGTSASCGAANVHYGRRRGPVLRGGAPPAADHRCNNQRNQPTHQPGILISTHARLEVSEMLEIRVVDWETNQPTMGIIKQYLGCWGNGRRYPENAEDAWMNTLRIHGLSRVGCALGTLEKPTCSWAGPLKKVGLDANWETMRNTGGVSLTGTWKHHDFHQINY